MEFFVVALVWWKCCWIDLQAAIWDALNHYSFGDAIFLAERLYAEGMYPPFQISVGVDKLIILIIFIL